MIELRDKCIRFDWAIKGKLRQKSNIGVLEGFLTVFLNEPIHIVEILESEEEQQVKENLYRTVIQAKNINGDIIIVEIRNITALYYLEHVHNDIAKDTTKSFYLGNTYKEVKKFYSINIIYFDFGKGTDYIYIGKNDFVGLHTQDKLIITPKEKDFIIKKLFSEIIPTYMLVRVNESNKVAKSPLEEWVNYLKNGVISPEAKAPGLQNARKILRYYSLSNAERYAYDEHVNAIMIQNDVLENVKQESKSDEFLEGKAEGRAEEKNDIARKMIKCGMSLVQISQITGLSYDQLKEL